MVYQRAFTLMELMLGIAILGIAVTIAIPSYERYIERTRIAQAITDMRAIEIAVNSYFLDFEEYPPNLDAAGVGGRLDPWDNPYLYTNLATATRGQARKDRNLVPINTDYDLSSAGPDGRSRPPLTAAHSRDDIVRANNGNYLGPASEY